MEAGMMNGATLAFIGDAVFELLSRSYVLEHGSKQPDRLHKRNTAIVNAAAQSAMLKAVQEQLDETELGIYKRGRNAGTETHAKHQTIGDYRRATGLEALYGYLYLTGQEERARELFETGIAAIAANETDAASKAVCEV